jgi:hypothetical protein
VQCYGVGKVWRVGSEISSESDISCCESGRRGMVGVRVGDSSREEGRYWLCSVV